MGAITIRQIDEGTKGWLRRRAAATGRSVEAELRHLLAEQRARDEGQRFPAGLAPEPGEGMGSWLHRISRPGVDLDIDRDRTPHHGIDL